MSFCLMVGAGIGAATLPLATPDFTLQWTHSVENIAWAETYQISGPVNDRHLILTRAAIKGSGAGMEPADSATWEDGWWVWHPQTQLPSLRLAASGATGAGWQLCTPNCIELGQKPGPPITIRPTPCP